MKDTNLKNVQKKLNEINDKKIKNVNIYLK
jgi:hypothetical protein